MTLKPSTPEEVRQAVSSTPCVLPRGRGTKTALSAPVGPPGETGERAPVETLELSSLTGVVEYTPQEFTLTARAGTPASEVERLLAEQGQYLPFDPLLSGWGATLGGTVASGATGSGRFRFGGVRDFLLGARFVDGEGKLVQGGGKVVKNAAGFDFPKLMVGSLGRLGVLVDLTFKVFPRPEARATLRVKLPGLPEALQGLFRLVASPLEIEALDLEPPSTLWIRLGGLAKALPPRMDRLRQCLAQAVGSAAQGVQMDEVDEEERHWQEVRDLGWADPGPGHAPGWTLLKVPLTPQRILAVEERLKKTPARRYYGAGGQQLHLAWPAEASRRELQAVLLAEGLRGLSLLGPPGPVVWGSGFGGESFLRRVKEALDPRGRFPAYETMALALAPMVGAETGHVAQNR